MLKFLKKIFTREPSPSDRLVDYIVSELFEKCPPDEWEYVDDIHWMTHPNSPIKISDTGAVSGVFLDENQRWEIVGAMNNVQKFALTKNKEQNAQKILDILKSNGHPTTN